MPRRYARGYETSVSVSPRSSGTDIATLIRNPREREREKKKNRKSEKLM